MKKISLTITLVIVAIIELAACFQTTPPLDSINTVYTIPYLKSYRADLIQKAMGCGLNIMYSSYTHPDGLRDAAHIMVNPYLYGGARCQAKQMYLKIFGYAQNYQTLQSPMAVSEGVKRALSGKYRFVVIDWKYKNLQKSLEFLNQFSRQMGTTGAELMLKIPASYICRQVNGQFFINQLTNIKKVIVEMYGQQPRAYKTVNQIFLSEAAEDNSDGYYPESRCPKFPSYIQLSRIASDIQFFIQKTLHTEEDGYVSEESIKKMLVQISGLYSKKMFYDGYPPNVIRL